jgi:2,4-dienoyl-CoA reductase-like NADH-dependent reductase (Old Yellow Enzyme family)
MIKRDTQPLVVQRRAEPHLFRTFTLRSMTARNRIMMSPMCQYSSDEGRATGWHLPHLAARATGGAGIVCLEATHVEARGRITRHCAGLWTDEQRDLLVPIVRAIRERGAMPAVQLAHAGRKASVTRPWEGGRPLALCSGGWLPIGPSAIPFDADYPVPIVMDAEKIAEVVAAFGAAARRAREAGFAMIEVHAAHGYLIHNFLSPLSNTRDDDYGGSLKNRARLLFEVIDAVRGEWPDELPLALRISATEWAEGGWDADDAVALARMLKAHGGVDIIDCSSGGNIASQQIPLAPGYQVPFAERIRRETGMATAAVGLIHAPEHAEEIIANGRADLVVLGRALLHNPHWPLHAEKALGAEPTLWPPQYQRANIF